MSARNVAAAVGARYSTGIVSSITTSYASPRPVFCATTAKRTRSPASRFVASGAPMAVASATVSTVPVKSDAAVGGVNPMPPSVDPAPFTPTTPLRMMTVGRTSSNRRIASSSWPPLFVEPSETTSWFVRPRSDTNGKSATGSVTRTSTVVVWRLPTSWNEPKFRVTEFVVASVVMNGAKTICPTAPLKALNDLFVWMNASPALTAPPATRTRTPVSASSMESKSAARSHTPAPATT